MRRRLSFVLIVLTILSIPALGHSAEEAQGVDSNFSYHTVKTKEGLSFRAPEDMPIETRGGIQAPIPFDEYMYGKFQEMNSRLKTLEEKLDHVEKMLESMTAPKKENEKKSPAKLIG